MSNSTITNRFLECLSLLVSEGKVKSKRQFALDLGYHPQGISEMAAQRRDAPLELIEKSIQRFRFNPFYLFTGKGSHFSQAIDDDGLRIKNLAVVTDQKGEERIVHVPYPAQAGYGNLLDDPVFMSELPSYQLPDPQFQSGTYRSFEIEGTSMEPTLVSKDIVIAAYIEPRFWEAAIRNGQLYIVVTAQEVVIKRIVNRIKTDQYLECCSDNPEYHTYSIPIKDILEIWKVRLKITSRLDIPTDPMDTYHISEQLHAQNKMLEHLHQQLTTTKIS